MDSKSLMIGDWVTFKDCQYENPTLIKIVGIGYQGNGEKNECLVKINGDEACDIIDIDDEIVGIPLTAEILWKNFPDPEIVCWYPDNNTYRIIIGDDIALNIKYVHELQHALRLCGIEKEIVL